MSDYIDEINLLNQKLHNASNVISSLRKINKDIVKHKEGQDEYWFKIAESLEDQIKILTSENNSLKTKLKEVKEK